MSRAFVKDQDDSEAIEEFSDRPISSNPNYVTPRGLRLMDAEISTLRHSLAEAQRNEDRSSISRVSRDLRYWVERRTTAHLIEPPADPKQVAFATRVTIRRDDGRTVSYAIVGEDEADLKQGFIAYTVPLARALLSNSVGEVVEISGGEAEIVKIEPVARE
ncbi:MAG TPA: GreA/GreB family elongation factor [Aestuariivirgaceae bacterium]|jgi:transcription elongation GreA/GreB family factor